MKPSLSAISTADALLPRDVRRMLSTSPVSPMKSHKRVLPASRNQRRLHSTSHMLRPNQSSSSSGSSLRPSAPSFHPSAGVQKRTPLHRHSASNRSPPLSSQYQNKMAFYSNSAAAVANDSTALCNFHKLKDEPLMNQISTVSLESIMKLHSPAFFDGFKPGMQKKNPGNQSPPSIMRSDSPPSLKKANSSPSIPLIRVEKAPANDSGSLMETAAPPLEAGLSIRRNQGTPFESVRLPTPSAEAETSADSKKSADYKFCGHCKSLGPFSNTQARKADGKCKKCIYRAMKSNTSPDLLSVPARKL